MPVLELVGTRPDWFAALSVALTRPPGVPERRGDEDPWEPAEAERPRRISDDLAWLRRALDDPARHGLRPLEDTASVGAWEAAARPATQGRLQRLRDRGVLDAAGFLLHEAEQVTVGD